MNVQYVPKPSDKHEDGMPESEHREVTMKQRMVSCATHAFVFIVALAIALLCSAFTQIAFVPFFAVVMAPIFAFYPIVRVFPHLYLTLPASLVLTMLVSFFAMFAFNSLSVQSSSESNDVVISMLVFMGVSAIAKYAAFKASGAELF